MLRSIANRLSPSMGVACLALFISLGGVSYGVATGSIDSREIKNSTIRGQDVKNNSLTGSDVRESSLGQVPSAGAANPIGPAGGNLTGSYPNPTIGPNTISGAKVADDSLTGADVNEAALETVPNAATLRGRAPSSFLNASVYTRQSEFGQGTDKGDGTFALAQACFPGDTLLSGGPTLLSPTTDLVESVPTLGSEKTSWSVRIQPNPGPADNFIVLINCVDQ